jgi:uncharacterized protein YgbK (DUF1537 family)
VDAGAANLELRAATVVAAALTLEASIIFVALLLVFGKLSSSSVEDFSSFSIKPRLLLVVSPKICSSSIVSDSFPSDSGETSVTDSVESNVCTSGGRG